MTTYGHTFTFLLIIWAALATAAENCTAQVVINAPPTIIDGKVELTAGQTLNVNDGGETTGSLFVYEDGLLNITGGMVRSGIAAHAGSEVNVSGGEVASDVNAYPGSIVNISGGGLAGRFEAFSGSNVTLSGGTVGRWFLATEGSNVELIGSEFRLNGSEFTGDRIWLNYSDVFTGTLADGSAFIFSTLAPDNLEGVTITQVPILPPDLTPKVVDSPVTSGPSGLRTGQSLTLQEGGVLPNGFAAVDATLIVNGGVLGNNTEIAGSTLTVIDGQVGTFLYAYSGSTINISGGTIGTRFDAFDSEANISGGKVGTFIAHAGTTAAVNGGTVNGINARDGWQGEHSFRARRRRHT